jgi:hypothetical protein
MIRIASQPPHLMRIAATLPLSSVRFEPADARGERMVWLDPAIVARLKAMRGPGESYSDGVLRLAKGGAGEARVS